MARDWDAEWHPLIEAERTAFQEMLDAQGPVTAIFARTGAPDMDLLDAAEVARDRWKMASAAVDKFIADFRASA